jgi:glyoxylase-like metal-dependent hydrolase (beta-lactamase superfamily II)
MSRSLLFHSRYILYTLSRLFLVLGILTAAHAEAPMAKTPAPGYYRTMLGQFEITALYDGYTGLEWKKLLRNAPEKEIQDLLSRMFIVGDKTETAVNAYLINTGSKLVLVDTGSGKLLGPTLGNALKNLRASGYEPSQVDAILLTHLNGDHIGGLVDDAGKPVYTNATIYISKVENDFCLSPAAAEKAPAALQPFLKKAREIVTPYIASGKWKTFEDSMLPIPGIKAIAIPGHTPGHTGFEVSSDGLKLFIWGDLVHSMSVQFTNPGVSIVFDINEKQAIATREAVFKSVADGTLVAGSHLPFPGIGKVHADGNNRYSWVPIAFFQLR